MNTLRQMMQTCWSFGLKFKTMSVTFTSFCSRLKPYKSHTTTEELSGKTISVYKMRSSILGVRLFLALEDEQTALGERNRSFLFTIL